MFEQGADPLQARDLIGYGPTPPDPKWPGGARIAVNFNLNYEGGGESTLANGDDASEGMLNDIGVPTKLGVRVPLVESVFEYGSRSGVWRVLRAFKESDVKVSVLGVVRALEQNPRAVEAFLTDGHEIVSHGWRWIDYGDVPEDVERRHVALAIDGITKLTGQRPLGWMTGHPGSNTGVFSSRRAAFSTTATRWRMSCLTGSGFPASPIWSFRIPMRPTTIVSTRTPASQRPSSSLSICETPSMCCTARERRRRSCSRSACTTV